MAVSDRRKIRCMHDESMAWLQGPWRAGSRFKQRRWAIFPRVEAFPKKKKKAYNQRICVFFSAPFTCTYTVNLSHLELECSTSQPPRSKLQITRFGKHSSSEDFCCDLYFINVSCNPYISLWFPHCFCHICNITVGLMHGRNNTADGLNERCSMLCCAAVHPGDSTCRISINISQYNDSA